MVAAWETETNAIKDRVKKQKKIDADYLIFIIPLPY